MMRNQIKTEVEIANIRQSGEILATILKKAAAATKPGVSALEIDQLCRKELKKHGATAAFLNYAPDSAPFPATICISINDEIVHGIPTADKVIQSGDLVGLDFGVNYSGMITDSAVTIAVGKVPDNAKRLLKYTQRALDAAIDVIKPGVQVGDIGSTVEKVFEAGNIAAIYAMCGHGVGHEVHEDPVIPNYGTAGTGVHLQEGMTVAIEPIASLGTHDGYVADDGWTFVTQDGSLSAQFEHTILITKGGAEVLTAW
ncbi:type I methionyl aminopeptidase [Candidatus Saccharibacteria bacterium]|nr:type I methionyl aminopeptidase [Candidatus Saccharibacteria bacterium]